MDLLHKRYASPFSLLDNMICSLQFSDFVEHLLNKAHEEEEDRKLWEFYLAKVHDKSFEEFKQSLKQGAKQGDVMEEAKKEEIITKSTAILNGFQPT